MRPASKDTIDDFIAKADDPDYWCDAFASGGALTFCSN